MPPTKHKQHRWYLGGIAGAGAACFTHPLDLLKVHLQVQGKQGLGLVQLGMKVFQADGVLGLYNGISASLMRQLTYSTARFGSYEVITSHLMQNRDGPLPFYQKVAVGGVSGFLGGLVGNPADMVNVRMQNDMKAVAAERRNYKHVFDGLYRVAKEEGPSKWMTGATVTATRGLGMTIGQVAVYDQTKQVLIVNGFFTDGIPCHLSSSFIAGFLATVITQPMDVVKTRIMNAKPGIYNGVLDCVLRTAKEGPLSFFKGFVPAWMRLAPHTIIQWLMLEQLRRLFPYK